MKKLFVIMSAFIALFIFAGCGLTDSKGDLKIPFVGESKSILVDKDVLVNIMNEFKEKPELKGKDIQVFQNIVLYDEEVRNFITIDIVKPGTSDQVDEYEYKGGQWSGPKAVKLTGNGEMRYNIAPLNSIDFSKVPDMYKVSADKAKEIEGGKVERSIVFVLNDEGFFSAAITIEGAREQWTARFDTRDGHLIEMEKN